MSRFDRAERALSAILACTDDCDCPYWHSYRQSKRAQFGRIIRKLSDRARKEASDMGPLFDQYGMWND